MLSRGSQKCVDVFGILPRFPENLLVSEDLVCGATAGTKAALGIVQLWFDYFAASFFKVLGIYFFREAQVNFSPVVDAFAPVYFFCLWR